MFDYEVLNEEEAMKSKEFTLLEEGIYPFVVLESEFKYSASGNPMIKLKLVITKPDKTTCFVFDNLIATKNMTWKTKHFCDATGMSAVYESKQFNESYCKDRKGLVNIGFVDKQPKQNGSGDFWKAKNDVIDYIKATGTQSFIPNVQAARVPSVSETTFVDSDVPF